MADLDAILEKLTALGEGQAAQAATCKGCMERIAEHHHTLYGTGSEADVGMKIELDRLKQAAVRTAGKAAAVVSTLISLAIGALGAIFGR